MAMNILELVKNVNNLILVMNDANPVMLNILKRNLTPELVATPK